MSVDIHALMQSAIAAVEAAAPRLKTTAAAVSEVAQSAAPQATRKAGRNRNVANILSNEEVVFRGDAANAAEPIRYSEGVEDRVKSALIDRILKKNQKTTNKRKRKVIRRPKKHKRKIVKERKATGFAFNGEAPVVSEARVEQIENMMGVGRQKVYGRDPAASGPQKPRSTSELLQELADNSGRPRLSYEEEQALLNLSKNPEDLINYHVLEGNNPPEGYYREEGGRMIPGFAEDTASNGQRARSTYSATYNEEKGAHMYDFPILDEQYNAQEILFGRGQIKIGEELFENSNEAARRAEYLNRHNIDPSSEEGQTILTPLRPAAPEPEPVPEDLGFIGRYAPQDSSAMVESAIPGLGSIEAGGAMGMLQTAMLGGAMGGALSVATDGEFGEGAVAGGIAGLGIRGVAGAIRANGASLERAMYRNVLGEGFNEGMTQAERVAALRATNNDNLGFVQSQAKSMLLSDRPSMTQQSRGAIMGGAALSGMMFTSNKKDHRRGFNKHRGNRI